MSKHKKHKNVVVTNTNNTTTITPLLALCHRGFTEVYPRIYVGRAIDIKHAVLKPIDVLIPLNNVDGDIWNTGWRGEIMYVPIKDYDTLPIDVEKWAIEKIINTYNEGKTIAIFCSGGHGRTGYLTSLVLGALGVDDPIKLLRANYCENAVETNKQVSAIANFLNKPELIKEYEVICYSNYDFYNSYFYAKTHEHHTQQNVGSKCERCICFNTFADSYNGVCNLTGLLKQSYDEACEGYMPDL